MTGLIAALAVLFGVAVTAPPAHVRPHGDPVHDCDTHATFPQCADSQPA